MSWAGRHRVQRRPRALGRRRGVRVTNGLGRLLDRGEARQEAKGGLKDGLRLRSSTGQFAFTTKDSANDRPDVMLAGSSGTHPRDEFLARWASVRGKTRRVTLAIWQETGLRGVRRMNVRPATSSPKTGQRRQSRPGHGRDGRKSARVVRFLFPASRRTTTRCSSATPASAKTKDRDRRRGTSRSASPGATLARRESATRRSSPSDIGPLGSAGRGSTAASVGGTAQGPWVADRRVPRPAEGGGFLLCHGREATGYTTRRRRGRPPGIPWDGRGNIWLKRPGWLAPRRTAPCSARPPSTIPQAPHRGKDAPLGTRFPADQIVPETHGRRKRDLDLRGACASGSRS